MSQVTKSNTVRQIISLAEATFCIARKIWNHNYEKGSF